jgi:hypothetical protein
MSEFVEKPVIKKPIVVKETSKIHELKLLVLKKSSE